MRPIKQIKASTISVLLRDSSSVSCFLKIGSESCNVSLRFDRDGAAKICGYPMSWGVYDCNLDYYDHDSPSYEELDEEGVQLDCPVYVSREVEIKILRKLQKDLEKQFSDPDWDDHCTDEYRTDVILQIENAIQLILQGEES